MFVEILLDVYYHYLLLDFIGLILLLDVSY